MSKRVFVFHEGKVVEKNQIPEPTSSTPEELLPEIEYELERMEMHRHKWRVKARTPIEAARKFLAERCEDLGTTYWNKFEDDTLIRVNWNGGRGSQDVKWDDVRDEDKTWF